MRDHSGSSPGTFAHQQLIRAKCVHPSGTFIEFKRAEIEQSIPARFEQQVRQYPHRLAVKTRNHVLTYEALNYAANRLAHAILTRRGTGAEPIALLFEQDAPAVVAILGVLKAGKLYVPLDPSYPRPRTAYMLRDSQATLIVTNTKNLALASELAQGRCLLLNIDEINSGPSLGNPGCAMSPDTLAYLLYTSGSTGQPKGVIQNHRNALHFIRNYTNSLHICGDDRLTVLASYSFMAGVRDTFSALLNGAALFPFDLREEGLAPLATWLIQEEITVFNAVATVFRHFVSTLTGAEQFPKLRAVKWGSEATYKRDVELFKKHFAPHCILYVGLGATETGTVRQYFIDKETELSGSAVPAGYEVEDIEVVLLDESGVEVGVNCIGEIAVKSRYLALGYWHKPDLTRAAFLPDPDGGDTRMYRTGDLGRLQPDGCLEILGRRDFQVKVRGQRIEVAEIELALLDHAAVKEVAVVAQRDQRGDMSLAAYVVPHQAPAPAIAELRSFAQQRLPESMVPAAFVLLDALPLTPTGKVDRKVLPAPESVRPHLARSFVAPRSPIEEALSEIWAQVLGLDRVGIHDNFLDLGGHSLLAMQVVTRVQDTFHVDVPLRSLLETPTVADMAVVITQDQATQVDPRGVEPILAKLEALTDEEAQRLLDGEHQERK